MKFSFHITNIILPLVASLVIITGCMKHAPVGELASPLPPLAATPGDKKIIVAKVNGAEITRYSLINVMNRMSQRGQSSDSREDIRKKALDRLVLEELAFQEARGRKLLLEDGAIDKAMGKVKAKLGNEEAYMNFLAKQNMSEAELRSSIERSLLIQLIVDKEVNKKTGVSNDDVRKEYERQKDTFIIPGKVTGDDIVLFLNKDDPALMTKVNEILAKINAAADKDPKNLAPDGTFIVQGLDVNKEQEPALYDAAVKLKPGELSGLIQGRDSLHIVKLTQYTPEKQLSFEEVKGSLEGTLKTAARKKRSHEWGMELKKSAKIEIVEQEDRSRKSADGSRKAEGGKD